MEDNANINEFERQRLERIRRNQEAMKQLGVSNCSPDAYLYELLMLSSSMKIYMQYQYNKGCTEGTPMPE
jgi:hypothetical protein